MSLYSKYVQKYVKSDVKTASGKRKSVDKGDAIAVALRGLSVAELKKIAQENEIVTRNWTKLNPGRFRMQVGRALRARARSGAPIRVNGKLVRGL